MLGGSGSSRARSFRPENLGQNALATTGNVCLAFFVLGICIITIVAATYKPEDPLFHQSSKITSKSNATFQSDGTAFATFNTITDSDFSDESPNENCSGPLDCRDPEVFHLMIESAIEQFKDTHFNRFGKAVPGNNDSTCDMAWHIRPKDGNSTAFNKDYRRFVISRSENCTYSVLGIGDYHSGLNARKKKKKTPKQESQLPSPVVESETAFKRRKYLIYYGGGDRCKNMNHYLWSLTCALGEAGYLNRTLVMDLSVCLNSMYSSWNRDEEGKDFRFYFDLEHLKEAASVLDQAQFWELWGKWQRKERLKLHLVEDVRVTPMKLAHVKDTLIMRKFGYVEPDNYWYRICEGEAENVMRRPWDSIRKSRRLVEIAKGIGAKLNWDYDSVRVKRGGKVGKGEFDRVEEGREVYVASSEGDVAFLEGVKGEYRAHVLEEYRELWDEKSEWYSETTKLNRGVPVEFDGYMRVSVDAEVFSRAKKQIETFSEVDVQR